MGNPKELRNARKRLADATESLARIEALPRRIGSLWRWWNGVVWERVGDDEWHAIGYYNSSGVFEPADDVSSAIPYSSAHVAGVGIGEKHS